MLFVSPTNAQCQAKVPVRYVCFAANHLKGRTFYDNKRLKIIKIYQLVQMACSALNPLKTVGMAVCTLDIELRKVVSMERKSFLLKEFLVLAEAIF